MVADSILDFHVDTTEKNLDILRRNKTASFSLPSEDKLTLDCSSLYSLKIVS